MKKGLSAVHMLHTPYLPGAGLSLSLEREALTTRDREKQIPETVKLWWQEPKRIDLVCDGKE